MDHRERKREKELKAVLQSESEGHPGCVWLCECLCLFLLHFVRFCIHFCECFIGLGPFLRLVRDRVLWEASQEGSTGRDTEGETTKSHWRVHVHVSSTFRGLMLRFTLLFFLSTLGGSKQPNYRFPTSISAMHYSLPVSCIRWLQTIPSNISQTNSLKAHRQNAVLVLVDQLTLTKNKHTCPGFKCDHSAALSFSTREKGNESRQGKPVQQQTFVIRFSHIITLITHTKIQRYANLCCEWSDLWLEWSPMKSEIKGLGGRNAPTPPTPSNCDSHRGDVCWHRLPEVHWRFWWCRVWHSAVPQDSVVHLPTTDNRVVVTSTA